MSYIDLSYTTTCGWTAKALVNILSYRKKDRQQITLPEVIEHLDHNRLVRIELNPTDHWWYESHVFVCLRFGGQYYVLDSYVKKKDFEIRCYDGTQFHIFMSNISDHPTVDQWCQLANLPQDDSINGVDDHYRISVESLLLNLDGFKNLCVLIH